MLTRAEAELLMPPHPFAGLRRHGYAAIVADPALAFTSYKAIQSTNPQSTRDLRRHYRCMSFDEILALPVADLAAKNGCHLFLWTSPPNIERSLRILREWGFEFSTKAFCWVKLRRGFDAQQLRFTPLMESDLHCGLGLTTRKQTEDVLLGRRGNCRRIAKDVREVILSPVREHSRKPEIYDRIERYCSGPFLELFARTRRGNWDAWGDQVDMFAEDGEVK